MIMNQQHKFDLELKKMEVDGMKTKEKEIEDRKDERVRIEGCLLYTSDAADE